MILVCLQSSLKILDRLANFIQANFLMDMNMSTIKYRVSQSIVPRLFGCCGGAVDSIISIFTQLHRSGVVLEFETCVSQYDKWLLN